VSLRQFYFVRKSIKEKSKENETKDILSDQFYPISLLILSLKNFYPKYSKKLANMDDILLFSCGVEVMHTLVEARDDFINESNVQINSKSERSIK
jgi:hypothetical protein